MAVTTGVITVAVTIGVITVIGVITTGDGVRIGAVTDGTAGGVTVNAIAAGGNIGAIREPRVASAHAGSPRYPGGVALAYAAETISPFLVQAGEARSRK